MDSKILLVDDEKDITDLIEEVLKCDGFRNIRKAYNGREAVNLCKCFEPDVVILDIMLPDLDGIEVCKQIRSFSYWHMTGNFLLRYKYKNMLPLCFGI